MTECHCGKDGHALNSINCPVHGMIDEGKGIGFVWIVFAQEHDRSGGPEFLAAYDGSSAEKQAVALVKVIEKAGCYRQVIPARVPLWPLVTHPVERQRPPGVSADHVWSDYDMAWIPPSKP
jgi:hypothetical protein